MNHHRTTHSTPARRAEAAVAASILTAGVLAGTHCSSDRPAPGPATAAARVTLDAGSVTRGPSRIVFVLADDLSWDLVDFMPNVRQMQAEGATFSRYFVTDSFCCPSRASIFTGKYPHDTTVFTNGGDAGGYAQFERAGNAAGTFAGLLAGAGYRTAMLGKYLNGYDPAHDAADPGWTRWAVAGNGYPEFDYVLNVDGALQSYGHAPEDYLTDVLSSHGAAFVRDAAGGPMLLEVATFAPHAPYTPAPRSIGHAPVPVARTPAFARANVNAPAWLRDRPDLDARAIASLDADHTLRVEAVQAVDDLVGALRAALAGAGIADSTYVVFSSDNGYHMGEHMMRAGKQTAFDTDIRVPLIVVGPGVTPGAEVESIAENIDLCPTFAEMAGIAAPEGVEGRSLLPLLAGHAPADWRAVALVEHHGPEREPLDPSDPDTQPDTVPPSYEALRLASSVYVEYATGETEYYDLTVDPWETTNVAASLPAARTTSLHAALAAVQSCHDARSCWAAQAVSP